MRNKQISMEELDRLSHDAPASEAAGWALDWLGDLERQEQHGARAHTLYKEAYTRFAGPIHQLAARGLGDVAFDRREYGVAQKYYREALAAAVPKSGMAIELAQKARLALTLERRRTAAWI